MPSSYQVTAARGYAAPATDMATNPVPVACPFGKVAACGISVPVSASSIAAIRTSSADGIWASPGSRIVDLQPASRPCIPLRSLCRTNVRLPPANAAPSIRARGRLGLLAAVQSPGLPGPAARGCSSLTAASRSAASQVRLWDQGGGHRVRSGSSRSAGRRSRCGAGACCAGYARGWAVGSGCCRWGSACSASRCCSSLSQARPFSVT